MRLRDLGKIWVSGVGPSELAAANAAPYASSGPHPSPAASPAIVEEPRARTESRCASEERRAPVACVTVERGHVEDTASESRRRGRMAAIFYENLMRQSGGASLVELYPTNSLRTSKTQRQGQRGTSTSPLTPLAGACVFRPAWRGVRCAAPFGVCRGSHYSFVLTSCF